MHELTKELWAMHLTSHVDRQDFDGLITSYLTQKKDDIREHFSGCSVSGHGDNDWRLKEILGLKDSKCEHGSKGCIKCGTDHGSPQPAVKEVWYPCMDRLKSLPDYEEKTIRFKKCPVCDAPRPSEPKSLAEIMLSKMKLQEIPRPLSYPELAEICSNAALKYFEELINTINCFTSADERKWIDKEELLRKVRGGR